MAETLWVIAQIEKRIEMLLADELTNKYDDIYHIQVLLHYLKRDEKPIVIRDVSHGTKKSAHPLDQGGHHS